MCRHNAYSESEKGIALQGKVFLSRSSMPETRVHHRFMIAALTNSDLKYRPLSIFNFRIMNMLEDNESDSQVKLILARGCQQANNIGFNY